MDWIQVIAILIPILGCLGVIIFQAGKVVKAVHTGDYSGLVNAHMEINEYMQSKNLTMAGNPWESYVTDPMTEKDTAKWVTEIYYPIQ
jgi:effector-binding domain-containing protein